MMQCRPAAQAICDVVVFQEPTLAEMLADPVIQAVMQADGVDPADLRALMDSVRRGA
jgi:hypothetical protein